MLSKSRSVLDKIEREWDIHSAWFSATDAGRGIAVPMQDWIDMGRPASITVTIEPGDLLQV